MTSKLVHIVLSDEGWILERLAKEISDRLPYVGYSLVPDSSVPLQYYITYGCRKKRVSNIEVALFTHREDDVKAAARFDQVAREVDYAVAMSGATDMLLSHLKEDLHSVISPGVDLDRFSPKLKIAVVGRTYHTGRKGEALVRSVLDVPHIDWHFTGSGWPEPALHVDDKDLPEFYRSMDYILVPALIEGGPMSVLEALASGVEVIAPKVGWVPDFPHIEFALGDPVSLRQVLEELVAKRFALRESVMAMTWENWALHHDALFTSLLSSHNYIAGHHAVPTSKVRSAALITHGIEDKTLGGPSVRVPGTVRALKTMNVDAHAVYNNSPVISKVDVVHSFNVWLPRTALTVARKVKALRKPFVFSPIMLDLSEAPLWRVDVLRAFRAAKSTEDVKDAMRFYRHRQSERNASFPPSEPEPGYNDMLREIAELSDGLIYLSEIERTAFTALTGTDTPGFIVRNPVEAVVFRESDPDLFRNSYGIGEYILCLGRIELRKNQLMLAAALADTGLTLVLVGHSSGDEYLQLIKQFGGVHLLHVDRLEPGSDMLRSAIAGARVFVLPSWSEGAPLAALEAGAAGVNLVLSDRSGEREYFGKRARYCDPSDIESIRNEVLAAWESPLTKQQSRALSDFVAEQYSWERYATDTLEVYETVLSNSTGPEKDIVDSVAATKILDPEAEIVLDITTWANFGNTLSGIVRVERSLALEFIKKPDIKARFIFYHSTAVGFLDVPPEVIRDNVLVPFIARLRSAKPSKRDLCFNFGSQLVAVGSSWMQNAEYAIELKQFARHAGLTLSVLMHDLTPALFPHWYLPGYSERWASNCSSIIQVADRLLVYSDSTTRDVLAFADKQGVEAPPIAKIRLADEIGMLTLQVTKEGEAVQRMMKGQPFVLCVGAIHIRKNYTLLYDVWTMLNESMGMAAPHLVIVGGVGWNGAEIARVMREDPRVSARIHIVESIDDLSLEWLYSHALMTVYPSLYEGWGLPVGESLAHGKICLSSNSSSMPEIARELTDLLDPLDRAAWAARIQHYASSRSSRARQEARIRAGFAITPWSTTATHIVDALKQPARDRGKVEAYNMGDVIVTSDTGRENPYLSSGWYRPENWGCWARSDRPTLELNLVHDFEEDLVFTALAKVLKPVQQERRYNVRANGMLVGTWVFPPKNPKSKNEFEPLINRVVVPRAILRVAESLIIEFEADRLCGVKEVNPTSQDGRSMGLGLIAFLMEPASLSADVATMLNGRGNLRTLLATSRNFDLPSLIAQSGYRPSILPDRWLSGFEPYLTREQLEHSGTEAQTVSLELTFGLGRLLYSRGAHLEFIVSIPSMKKDIPTNVTIFLNANWLGTVEVESSEPTLCSIAVPYHRLFEIDPASFSFFTSGTKKSNEPNLKILQLRLRQDVSLDSDTHAWFRPGKVIEVSAANRANSQLDIALARGWYLPESLGAWSMGSAGGLDLALDLREVEQAYLVARVARLRVGFETHADRAKRRSMSMAAAA